MSVVNALTVNNLYARSLHTPFYQMGMGFQGGGIGGGSGQLGYSASQHGAR